MPSATLDETNERAATWAVARGLEARRAAEELSIVCSGSSGASEEPKWRARCGNESIASCGNFFD